MNRCVIEQLNEFIDELLTPTFVPRHLVHDDKCTPPSLATWLEASADPDGGLESIYGSCQKAAYIFCYRDGRRMYRASGADGIEHPMLALVRFALLYERCKKANPNETIDVGDLTYDFRENNATDVYGRGTYASPAFVREFDNMMQTERMRVSTEQESIAELARKLGRPNTLRIAIVQSMARSLRVLTPDMCDDPLVVWNIDQVFDCEWFTGTDAELRAGLELSSWLYDYAEQYIQTRNKAAAEASFQEHAVRKRRCVDVASPDGDK